MPLGEPDGEMSMYSLVSLVPEDLPDIMEVERLSFAHPWSPEAFAAEFEKPYSSFLGIRLDGRVIAVCLYWVVLTEIHILSLGVHPDHRRKGCASALLEVLVEMGRELGCDRIDLEVRESNTPGQQLYENSGFVRVGVRPRYYPDTDEDAILYTLFLQEHVA